MFYTFYSVDFVFDSNININAHINCWPLPVGWWVTIFHRNGFFWINIYFSSAFVLSIDFWHLVCSFFSNFWLKIQPETRTSIGTELFWYIFKLFHDYHDHDFKCCMSKQDWIRKKCFFAQNRHGDCDRSRFFRYSAQCIYIHGAAFPYFIFVQIFNCFVMIVLTVGYCSVFETRWREKEKWNEKCAFGSIVNSLINFHLIIHLDYDDEKPHSVYLQNQDYTFDANFWFRKGNVVLSSNCFPSILLGL